MVVKQTLNSIENQGFILLHSGDLVIIEDQSTHENFCLDNTENVDETIAMYCDFSLDSICREKICVRKCCPMGHVRREPTSNQTASYF